MRRGILVIKSLKARIKFIYLCLVILIALIGITSTISVFKLRRSIDVFMIHNYKSINAADNMTEVLEKENVELSNFVSNGEEKNVDDFYQSNDEFFNWLNVESSNITEKGEKESVDSIKKNYGEYLKTASRLTEIRNSKGLEEALRQYANSVEPVYGRLRSDLRTLTQLNEDAMLMRKEEIKADAQRAMNSLMVISIISVIGGFVMATLFINKLFKPIALFTETIKKIKQGNMFKEVPVVSEDEIGAMAQEFNNMMVRLKEFDESTMGQLLYEKNKTLAIVKSICDPLIVLDNNCRITLINNACEDFFCIDETSVQGRHLLEAIRDGDLFDYIWSICTGEEEHNQKIIQIKVNDEEKFFNVIVSAVKDKNDEINNIIVLFQNVTEIKKVEKMKSDFISSVSHEFKTPLTSLIMGTELIMNAGVGVLNEKQKDIVNTMKEDSNQLLKLVNNLLELSKLENDRGILNIRECQICDVVKDSLKNFHTQAQNKGVKLLYEIEEDMPNVECDNEKVGWVINNLVSNAIKFTGKDDSIWINVHKGNNRVYVSVKDTGVGIPEKYTKKIFDKFVQLEAGTKFSDSSGLGLAIAKEIIEVHNGEIWCNSVIGEGSEFIFCIPISRGDMDEKGIDS